MLSPAFVQPTVPDKQGMRFRDDPSVQHLHLWIETEVVSALDVGRLRVELFYEVTGGEQRDPPLRWGPFIRLTVASPATPTEEVGCVELNPAELAALKGALGAFIP